MEKVSNPIWQWGRGKGREHRSVDRGAVVTSLAKQ